MSRDVRGRWSRRVGRALILASALIVVLTARVVMASRGELEAAEDAERAGDIDIALLRYRRAAAWYAPANPYSADALRRLITIAEEADAADDLDRRLLAWRSVRAAILSTRSFFTPNADALTEANRQIADAMASYDPPPVDLGKSQDQVRQEHLELLERSTRPSVAWTLLALLGFFAWAGGAVAFTQTAIDEDDHLVGAPARLWGTLIVVGLGMFFLGLALA